MATIHLDLTAPDGRKGDTMSIYKEVFDFLAEYPDGVPCLPGATNPGSKVPGLVELRGYAPGFSDPVVRVLVDREGIVQEVLSVHEDGEYFPSARTGIGLWADICWGAPPRLGERISLPRRL